MNSISNDSIVLVAGATGVLGGEICRQLIEEGRQVRALVRITSDTAKVAALKDMGVEVVEADLKDRASLAKAVSGAAAIISTVSSSFSRQEGDTIQSVDEAGQTNLVRAAVEAGISQFVFISFCTMQGEFPLQSAKRNVEKQLVDSGMKYTILQPTYFMDIWLSPALGFDAAARRATIYGSGKNKVSWIPVPDVAFFAVSALDNKELENATIELGGPQQLSPLEVVAIFEKISGTSFEIQHVPDEALAAQAQQAADPLSQSFAGLLTTVAAGSVIEMKGVFADLQKELTTVEEYARSVNQKEMTDTSPEDIQPTR